MPKTQDRQNPANFAKPQKFTEFWIVLAFFLLSLGWFGWNLPAEPHFVDESAYLSQSYYFDLLISSQRDRPEWLWYAGYDLPPLTKYLVGGALCAAGYPRPPITDSWRWYADTSTRIGTPAMLNVARWPSVILGAIGVCALYGMGRLSAGRFVGVSAAVLFLANPLYTLHGRRAMSDVPAESFLLVSTFLGLLAWTRLFQGRRISPAILLLAAGVATGLSVLSKLNGSLAGMILAAWLVLGIFVWNSDKRGLGVGILGTVGAGVLAFAVFAALNPFLTATPTTSKDPRIQEMVSKTFVQRVKAVSDHRVEVSRLAMNQFPHNGLPDPASKIAAVAVQGFGRFGPFGPAHSDSKVRFDRTQDWGGVLWGPLTLLGLLAALTVGLQQRRSGAFPAAWAIALQAVLVLMVVTAFIPLAWDRYFLSIQAPLALLGGLAIGRFLERVAGRLRPVLVRS